MQILLLQTFSTCLGHPSSGV